MIGRNANSGMQHRVLGQILDDQSSNFGNGWGRLTGTAGQYPNQ